MPKYITAFGETKTIKEWSLDERCKVGYQLLHLRLSRTNWTPEKAISQPTQKQEDRIKMKVGEKINRLTLKRIYKKEESGIMCSYGEFECECGSVYHGKIARIVNESIKSCRCYSIDRITELNKTHGMSKTKEYYAWGGLKNRCHNINDEKYKAYGGRGIKVCDRWFNSFENFFEDMGESPDKSYHLGRIDHHKGYSKDNCRWTSDEQEKIDDENGKIIIAWGEPKPLLWWLEDSRCNADIDTIKYRLWVLGWSTEKAIETFKD